MRRQSRSVLTGIFSSSFLKTFPGVSGREGVRGGITVAGGKTAGRSGLSWVDLTSNVSYFCWPVWAKWGGCVCGGEKQRFKSFAFRVMPTSQTWRPRTPRNSQRKRTKELSDRAGGLSSTTARNNALLSKKASRSFKCSAQFIRLLRSGASPGFAFQWTLTPWAPRPPLPLPPACPSFPRFPFRTEGLERSHLWPERRGGGSGAEGRVRACGSVPPRGCSFSRARASYPPGEKVKSWIARPHFTQVTRACGLQTVKLVPGNLFFPFFLSPQLEVDSTPSDGRIKHSRCD